jgi:hypothetical protein
MVTKCFLLFFMGGLLIGDPNRYKSMIKPLVLEMKLLSPQGPCWGTWSGGSFTRDFEEKV